MIWLPPHRHEALGVNWPRGPTIPYCYRRHQAINTFYSPTAATTINLFFSAQAVMMVTILLGHTFFFAHRSQHHRTILWTLSWIGDQFQTIWHLLLHKQEQLVSFRGETAVPASCAFLFLKDQIFESHRYKRFELWRVVKGDRIKLEHHFVI